MHRNNLYTLLGCAITLGAVFLFFDGDSALERENSLRNAQPWPIHTTKYSLQRQNSVRSPFVSGFVCAEYHCEKIHREIGRVSNASLPVPLTADENTFVTAKDKCPEGLFVTSVKCSDRSCKSFELICSALDSHLHVDKDDTMEIIIARKKDARVCPTSYYVSGLSCMWRKCRYLKAQCVHVQPYPADRSYEEGDKNICDILEDASDLRHTGECSNVWGDGSCEQLYQPIKQFNSKDPWGKYRSMWTIDNGYQAVMPNADVDGSYDWSAWIHTRKNNNDMGYEFFCGSRQLVSQIQCSESYCGEIRGRCSDVDDRFSVDFSNGYWSSNYIVVAVNIQGQTCDPGYWVAGISCHEGAHCWHLHNYCVKVRCT